MKRLTLALLAALAIAPALAAQDIVLTGSVTTREDGLPLPGATVAIASLGLSVTTDASGLFTLTLPTGTVMDKALDVRVSAAGLLPRVWPFKPAPGTTRHDFALALSFSEEITVGSRVVGVEAQKAVPIDILSSRQIQPRAPARRCRCSSGSRRPSTSRGPRSPTARPRCGPPRCAGSAPTRSWC